MVVYVANKNMLQGYVADACERHQSVIGSVIFSPFLKTEKTFASQQSSGTSSRVNDSLKISVSIGGISLLHSFITMAFSPSGPDALCTFSLSNCLATPFGSSVIPPLRRMDYSPLRGLVRVCFTCECCLKLPFTNVGFFL